MRLRLWAGDPDWLVGMSGEDPELALRPPNRCRFPKAGALRSLFWDSEARDLLFRHDPFEVSADVPQPFGYFRARLERVRLGSFVAFALPRLPDSACGAVEAKYSGQETNPVAPQAHELCELPVAEEFGRAIIVELRLAPCAGVTFSDALLLFFVPNRMKIWNPVERHR